MQKIKMFKEHNMTVFRTDVIPVKQTEKSTIKGSPTGLTLNMRTFVVDPEIVNICIIGQNELSNLEIWLAVHRSIVPLLIPTWYTILMNYIKLHKIKFLYMLRAPSAHLQEVNDVNCLCMQPLVSSFSVGGSLVHLLTL